jgi:acyl carrier protein
LLPPAFEARFRVGMTIAEGLHSAVEQKGNTMNSPSQALVHNLLASHLQVDAESLEDGDTLVELGLDALDMVLVVLRLEDLCGGEGGFPLGALAHARTVGDFIALADRWLQEDTMPYPAYGFGSRRGSAA